MSNNIGDQKNNSDQGLKKNWLFSRETNNLTKIIIAFLPAFLAYLGSSFKTDQSIKKVEQKIVQVVNIGSTKVDDILGVGTSIVTDDKKEDFIKDNWNSYVENLPVDDSGYICPGNPGSYNWVLWTKNKYNANQEVNIVFSLLDKTNNNKKPTLTLSYGDKTNKKLITLYTINFLDGDQRTIRLYANDKNDIYERSEEDVPTDKYLTLNISPGFKGKNSSKLILNPSLSYLIESNRRSFQPDNEFKVDLPFTEQEQGAGYQYALGISKGDCFKIISSNL